MDQEVLGTRDDENIKGLRQPAGEIAEGLDSLAGGWADAYRDERLDGPAEGIQVDVGMKAPEHSSSRSARTRSNAVEGATPTRSARVRLVSCASAWS